MKTISEQNILEVRKIKVNFNTDQGSVYPVDDVSFNLKAGDVLGIVGESGCGKTLTALSCLNLVPYPGVIRSGEVLFKGEDILSFPEKKIRKIRGSKIAMVFQESMTALNPVYRIGYQMASVISRNKNISKKQANKLVVDSLVAMGVPGAEERLRDFPHQLSGGMRQRVLIALALACEPELLIADEPTTALDVTTQSMILESIGNIQSKKKMATIFVSHDLGVVSDFCDSVLVMYCGRVVEKASTSKLFSSPRHPYTIGLLQSIPQIHQHSLSKLPTIEGSVPSLTELQGGCRFANRCTYARSQCFQSEPDLQGHNGHEVACFFPQEIK